MCIIVIMDRSYALRLCKGPAGCVLSPAPNVRRLFVSPSRPDSFLLFNRATPCLEHKSYFVYFTSFPATLMATMRGGNNGFYRTFSSH